MSAKQKKNHLVIRVEWVESERGWGIKPDGYSLHINGEDVEKFIKAYWKKMPDAVQDVYSLPEGQTTQRVDEATYKKIKKSKHGVRFY